MRKTNVGGARSWLIPVTIVLVLVGAGAAFAASGLSSLVGSDDGATSGRAAQQPLGTLSASPPAGETLGQKTPNQDNGVASEEEEDGFTQVAGANEGGRSGAGGDGKKLPFTGFLAITVLLVGAGLLTAGLVLRRRADSSATAAG